MDDAKKHQLTKDLHSAGTTSKQETDIRGGGEWTQHAWKVGIGKNSGCFEKKVVPNKELS